MNLKFGNQGMNGVRMENIFKGKRVLVTGGTGSIGSEIVRRLLKHEPKVVRIFSRDETKQFELQQELGDREDLRFLIGDVRDRDRLTKAFEEIDIVFHAAAMKHVPACEYNPFEAVKTNVEGTQNIIDAALENKVEKVVAISTDKAVNPINTMGATKFLSEQLMINTYLFTKHKKTTFSCVRFGNVMGSRGSVIPLFEKQIKAGGPLTLTHPDMTRFIMSIPQAVDLVFKATKMSRGGEIFIFKMPVVKIEDLAKAMILNFAPLYGYQPQEIDIKDIGIRDGEKMYECLMTEEEAQRAFENEYMFIVHPNKSSFEYEEEKRARHKSYSSTDQEPLNVKEIRQLFNTH